MNYEDYASLDELLKDSSASEFLDVLADIPVTLPKSEFASWVTSQAIPSWDLEYKPVLTALLRLVEAEADYGLAMTEIKRYADALAPALEEEEDDDDLESDDTPGEDNEDNEDDEEVPPPGDAATEVAKEITIPAIEALRAQYPDVAARFTAEEIAAAAMRATTAATVGEGGQ